MKKDSKKKLRIAFKRSVTVESNLDKMASPPDIRKEDNKERFQEGILEKFSIVDDNEQWDQVYVLLNERALFVYTIKPDNKDSIDNLIEKISLDGVVFVDIFFKKTMFSKLYFKLILK